MKGSLCAVVMAGGRGTRFWPASTRGRPKQFIDLVGGGTMLQMTVSRLSGLCGLDRVLIVTGAGFADEVFGQIPGLPVSNLLLEPMPMNTSACIGWAARVAADRWGPDTVMAVMPSDHLISPASGFVDTIARAVEPARQGWLVTVGVRPDRAATGYGYIKPGDLLDGFHPVEAFVEKPRPEVAQAFLEAGSHFWNAGIFVWRASAILGAISEHLPGLSDGLERLGTDTSADPVVYGSLPAISIDYGIMERSSRVAMVEAGFAWDDIGDWPALRRSGACRGEVISLDSSDCTVWNPDSLTVMLGVSGISVVRAGGVILVMADDYAQKLRDVVGRIEQQHPELV
jgi:mannose-1-phosphate guanylyltransferase